MDWPRFFVSVFATLWCLAIWLSLRMTIARRRRGGSRPRFALILLVAAMIHLHAFRHFADLRDWAYHSACEREYREMLELKVNLDHAASSLELHRERKREALARLLDL